jgi:hypothetical protein
MGLLTDSKQERDYKAKVRQQIKDEHAKQKKIEQDWRKKNREDMKKAKKAGHF